MRDMGNGQKRRQCVAITKSGTQCQRNALSGLDCCGGHKAQGKPVRAQSRGAAKAKAKDAMTVEQATEVLARTDWAEMSYALRLRAFRVMHELWSNEDILAAVQMEIELMGCDPAKASKRGALIAQAVAARKLISTDKGDGKRQIQITINHKQPAGERPKP